ncbi:MAG: NYN domain-containing protein [Patescibacteria group bacterium]
MIKPKVKIYIDGANIFYAQKEMGWSLDWLKIKEYLAKHYAITEIRYYQGIKEDDANIARYLKYLDHLGVTVITKPLKVIKISDRHPMKQLHNYTEIYKCNFDVEITADMIFDRTNIDEYILFSGDSDFDYVVKRLRDVGKRFTVYSSKKVLSWELKLAVNRYEFLEKYQENFAK